MILCISIRVDSMRVGVAARGDNARATCDCTRAAYPITPPPALYIVHQSDRVRTITPRVPSPCGHWGKRPPPSRDGGECSGGGLFVVRC